MKENTKRVIENLFDGSFVDGKMVIQNGQTESQVRDSIKSNGGSDVDDYFSITHFADMVIICE